MSIKEPGVSDLTKLEYAANALGEAVGRALTASVINMDAIRGPRDTAEATAKDADARGSSNRIQSLINQLDSIRESADKVTGIQHSIEYAVGAPKPKVATQSR